jgi:hypothetical protein
MLEFSLSSEGKTHMSGKVEPASKNKNRTDHQAMVALQDSFCKILVGCGFLGDPHFDFNAK